MAFICDVEMMVDLTIAGGGLVAGGLRTFEPWAAAMLNRCTEIPENRLSEVFDAATAYFESVSLDLKALESFRTIRPCSDLRLPLRKAALDRAADRIFARHHRRLRERFAGSQTPDDAP